ncbi:hypothetical protein N802_04260 [Knoellia sinensis KCTC 19936]|uniref:Uncharacterized protein n=2 Tax=Knoellia TaxID=136099 RepID=A0A0A0J2E7_9MICO|nr:hypothetical protein N802_04260 [Knoellia sinensis KCTC 19936]
MVVSAYSDPAFIAERLGGAPAAAIPAVLAAQGDSFLVEVDLRAGTGGSLDAAYPSAQTVTFSASGPGTLSPSSATIPGGTTTAVFTVSYSAEANGVAITATVGNGKKAIRATSNTFDITRFLEFVEGDSAALRNGTAGADGAACTTVDRATPLCGIVILPRGASSHVALTLAECRTTDACLRGSLVTQMIANLTANGTNLYDRANPARMELVCDKTMCGRAGVNGFTALWSRTAFGALTPVPACSAKGVIDATLEYCTDYRASQRDNAGDLHLVVLFLDDVRGSI